MGPSEMTLTKFRESKAYATTRYIHKLPGHTPIVTRCPDAIITSNSAKQNHRTRLYCRHASHRHQLLHRSQTCCLLRTGCKTRQPASCAATTRCSRADNFMTVCTPAPTSVHHRPSFFSCNFHFLIFAICDFQFVPQSRRNFSPRTPRPSREPPGCGWRVGYTGTGQACVPFHCARSCR